MKTREVERRTNKRRNYGRWKPSLFWYGQKMRCIEQRNLQATTFQDVLNIPKMHEHERSQLKMKITSGKKKWKVVNSIFHQFLRHANNWSAAARKCWYQRQNWAKRWTWRRFQTREILESQITSDSTTTAHWTRKWIAECVYDAYCKRRVWSLIKECCWCKWCNWLRGTRSCIQLVIIKDKIMMHWKSRTRVILCQHAYTQQSLVNIAEAENS